MSEDIRSIELTRIAENHYRATAPSGASIEFGRGEGLMTPVELLLAAVAGCASKLVLVKRACDEALAEAECLPAPLAPLLALPPLEAPVPRMKEEAT